MPCTLLQNSNLKVFPSCTHLLPFLWVFWGSSILRVTVPCIPAWGGVRRSQTCGCRARFLRPPMLPPPGTTGHPRQHLHTAPPSGAHGAAAASAMGNRLCSEFVSFIILRGSTRWCSSPGWWLNNPGGMVHTMNLHQKPLEEGKLVLAQTANDT